MISIVFFHRLIRLTSNLSPSKNALSLEISVAEWVGSSLSDERFSRNKASMESTRYNTMDTCYFTKQYIFFYASHSNFTSNLSKTNNNKLDRLQL